MGIDRIGKGGTAPPPDLDKVGKSDAVEKPFTAERAERPKAAGAVDATQTASPLAQFITGHVLVVDGGQLA